MRTHVLSLRARLIGLIGCGIYVISFLGAGLVYATNFQVNWVQELSSRAVWRFELINASVDTVDVQQLTVTFYAEGRRLWSLPVAISPSYLRPGESGWVTLDTSTIPKVLPLRLDWEATWNPYYVPTLSKYWKKELVASVEIDTNGLEGQSGPALSPPPNYGRIQLQPGPGRSQEAPRVLGPGVGEM